MKPSEVLREAAMAVEAEGRVGLFSATRYSRVEDGKRASEIISEILPVKGSNGLYGFSPANLPMPVRATILGLSAAIAESEGE